VSKSDGRTFTNLHEEDGFNYPKVYTTYEDQNGNLCFGTPQGVNMYDGEQFYSITKEDGLSDNRVYSIIGDGQGNLWFGSMHGLTRFTPLKTESDTPAHKKYGEILGRYKVLTTDDGLSDNAIISMVYHEDYLWLGTHNGVDQLNVTAFNATGVPIINHYGQKEGFMGIECDENASYKDDKGNLYFGTIRGVIKFRPELLQVRNNRVPPQTHITDIRLFLEEKNWQEYTDSTSKYFNIPMNLKLPFDQNHLTFDYTALSLTIPEKVAYQYKLEGFDQSWSPVTQQTYATYSNLPPGSYTFKVRARNNDGVWNEKPARFSFVIRAPFWQTWWFYVVCIVVAAALVYTVIIIRTKRLQQSKRLLELKVKERTKDLEQANRQLEKLSLVASRSHNAIVIADANGKIEWINESFARMTGYTLEDVKGTTGEILRKNKRRGLSNPDIVNKVVTTKQPYSYEAKNYSRDGEAYWTLSTLTPVVNEKNEVEKIIAIDSDITERKRAEQETVQAKKQAEKAKQREEEFIANISHELRTPLNGIMGMTHILTNENLDDKERQEYLKAIDSSANNLLAIINDILDFSKIKAGEMTFDKKPFKVKQVVKGLYHTLSFKARQKT
jgi:PAS domain S-box-containing protein